MSAALRKARQAMAKMATGVGVKTDGLVGAAAAQMAGLSRRGGNLFAFVGDSRLAYMFADAAQFFTASNQFFVRANHMLDQRMVSVYNSAVAGQRSDQYLSGHAGALLSRASWYVLWGIYNDLAQGFTDQQAWDGYNGSIGIKAALDQARAAGMRPIIVTETGGTGFPANTAKFVFRYNERLRAYAQMYQECILFDIASIVWEPTATTTFTFRTGFSTDGIHLTGLGSYFAGKAFAALMQPLVPAFPQKASANFDTPTNDEYSTFSNGLLVTTTGGTAGTGITGSAPSGLAITRTGGATATLSTGASPDGYGNELILQCTFAATSEMIQIQKNTSIAALATGDKVYAGCDVAVDAGSVNFAGVMLKCNVASSTTNPSYGDNSMTGVGVGPTEAYAQSMKTPDATLPAGLTSINMFIQIFGSGAGSATVRVRRLFNNKRFLL